MASHVKIDNLSYGYNSTKAAVVGIWKHNLATMIDKRGDMSKEIAKTQLHWFANLIVYGATEHFIKDGDVNKPAYSDRLANAFSEFLLAEVGIKSQSQRDKFSSVVSALLGVRKNKAAQSLLPIREAAIADGAPGVIKFLEANNIKTFNELLGQVQPGADKMQMLASRIAKLSDEEREKLVRFLGKAADKAERLALKNDDKAKREEGVRSAKFAKAIATVSAA